MNRENLPEVVLAVTLGLLVVVAAAYRTTKVPSPGVRRRSAMAALLVYAVIATPVFVSSGMSFWLLMVLVGVLALPLVAAAVAPRYTTDSEGAAESAVRALVGTGLAAALLVGAGETLAMIGRVDPRTVVIVIAAIAALVTMGQGLAGSSRIGSLALWLLIVPALISIALGIFLGSAAEAVSPIVEVPGPSWAGVAVVALGVFVIGWADNTLRATTTEGAPGHWRTWLGTAAIVVVIAFGQLMFLGGAVIAILTVVFTALVALVVTGASAAGAAGSGLTGAWAAGIAVVAAGIALFDPGVDRILIVTALAAAALAGAQLGGRAVNRGVGAGLVVAAIAVVLLSITSRLELEVAAVAAMAVVLVVALATSKVGASTTQTDSDAPSPRQ